MLKKTMLWRIAIYFLGLILLALGVSLSARTGLGITTISSVPYALSRALNWNFAWLVFIFYAAMIFPQMLIKGKRFRRIDWLQIPVSYAISVFINWFDQLVQVQLDQLWQNLLVLCVSVVCCGIAVALMLNMELIPNPPDGFAEVLGQSLGKDMGFGKNVLDACCVTTAVIIDLAFTGGISSVGLGTVISSIFIGRSMAAFNRFFRTALRRPAGLE